MCIRDRFRNVIVKKKKHTAPDGSVDVIYPPSSFSKSLFPDFPDPVDASPEMSAGLLHVAKSSLHWELFDSVTQRRIDEVWITK